MMLNTKNKIFVSTVFVLLVLLTPTTALVQAKKNVLMVPGDYPTIQAAVDAANPGDAIIVNEGIYQEMVSIYKPLTIIGKNAIVETPDLYGFNIQAVATVSGFTIQPFENGGEHHAGIHFGLFYSGGAAIGNEILEGFSIGGIVIHGPSGILIKGNIIHSSSSGVCLFDPGSDFTVVDNVISSVAQGIQVFGSSFKILGNKITSGFNGIAIVNSVNSIAIDNEISAGENGVGIGISDSSKIVVARNVIHNSFSIGRGVDSSNCEKVSILDNEISTVDIGIHFYLVTKGIVSRNEVIIENGEPSNSLGIVFNTVSDCEASDNVVIGGDRSMWAMWSDRVIIKNNEFSPNSFNMGGTGIYLACVANSLVTKNRVVGNVLEGISLDQGSNANYILKNTIIISGSNGIWLSWETFGNYVIGNRISSAGTPIQDDSGLNIIIP